MRAIAIAAISTVALVAAFVPPTPLATALVRRARGSAPMSMRGGMTLALNVSRDDVLRWDADYPEERPSPPGGDVFELGICMAGAISAGAYTAGVLDFLIEALDAFAKENADREKRGAKPLHAVQVPVLGGASAGGMCAAIAAIFLDRNFPAVHNDTSEDERLRNPFWRAWVKNIEIMKLLSTTDITDGNPPPSLLNGNELDKILNQLIEDHPGMVPTKRERPWLVSPLRALLTLTDLRGVPYALRFDGENDRDLHWMSLHADFVSYVIDFDKTAGATPGLHRKVGETQLDLNDMDAREDFKAAALGTGSFPFAFPPRKSKRDPKKYLFRAAMASPLASLRRLAHSLRVNPNRAPPEWLNMLCPQWEDDCNAAWIDGGALNNEPFDLVRRELEGWRRPEAAENTGNNVSRIVLLIDPFVKREDRDVTDGLRGVFDALTRALLGNSRLKLEELALAADCNISSRFMIAPSRNDTWKGECAIAGGYMGGFLGFFNEKYREHDYFLGRRNAQHFLKDHFVLPENNRVFKYWEEKDKILWGKINKTRWGDDIRRLPVIPLCGDLLSREEVKPDWPKYAFDDKQVKQVKQAITDRIGKVVSGLVDSDSAYNKDDNWTKRLFKKTKRFFSNKTVISVCAWLFKNLFLVPESHALFDKEVAKINNITITEEVKK